MCLCRYFLSYFAILVVLTITDFSLGAAFFSIEQPLRWCFPGSFCRFLSSIVFPVKNVKSTIRRLSRRSNSYTPTSFYFRHFPVWPPFWVARNSSCRVRPGSFEFSFSLSPIVFPFPDSSLFRSSSTPPHISPPMGRFSLSLASLF